MKGKKYNTASRELLIRLKSKEKIPPPISKSPHRPTFMLKTKPKRVSQIPLFAGWVLVNRRMKTKAITMEMGIVGTNLLSRVNIKIPKPRMNKTKGR
jgi:hypothetical protein